MITLIVGSLGRETALRRLLDSLVRQTYKDFCVLLIDQSGHDGLVPIVADYPTLIVRRIVAQPGLSRARNLGLSLAEGEIVAFPDDDAWYPPDLLEHVGAAFESSTVDGLSFRVTDEAGICSAGGYMASGAFEMTKTAIWRSAVSCSFFLRREAVGTLRFDERLGVGSGTPLGAGEETEFLLRLLEQGRHLLYDGSLTVYHPVFRGPWRVARGWTYGCGHGWVLRRHRYGMWRLFWAVAIQGARAMQAVLTGRWRKALFHLAQAAGRFWGYAVLWRRITPGRCA